jgi:hypothetical protein
LPSIRMNILGTLHCGGAAALAEIALDLPRRAGPDEVAGYDRRHLQTKDRKSWQTIDDLNVGLREASSVRRGCHRTANVPAAQFQLRYRLEMFTRRSPIVTCSTPTDLGHFIGSGHRIIWFLGLSESCRACSPHDQVRWRNGATVRRLGTGEAVLALLPRPEQGLHMESQPQIAQPRGLSSPT